MFWILIYPSDPISKKKLTIPIRTFHSPNKNPIKPYQYERNSRKFKNIHQILSRNPQS